MAIVESIELDQPASRASHTSLLSVVVPVYNEEQSVGLLYEELDAALAALGRPCEIIFVNDGSTDRSRRILDEIAEADKRVTAIHLRRNFGQTAALMAGIDHCRGATIVTLDGDLQNDPADIPALLEKLDHGYDVVSGWRKDRQDAKLSRTIPSKCANWLIRRISGVPLHDFGCTLKAYRREVVEDVRLYGEMHRFVPLYAHMQGGTIAELVVHHRPRRFGQSKYGLGRAFKVVLDLLLLKFLSGYTAKPFYIFGGFGLGCLLLSLFPVGLAVFYKFNPVIANQKDFVETPLPVIASVCILVGFLALLQGLLAEMLMRTYFESQDKRTYLVAKTTTRS